MKKVIFWILVYCFVVSRLGFAAPEDVVPKTQLLPFANQTVISPTHEVSLPSPKESPAYHQYLKRPKSELSKIIFLLDHFKTQKVKIIYNDNYYQPAHILGLVRAHIALTYKKESAEEWIRKNAYKSWSKNKIIYLEYPEGHRKILRDLLLEELAVLPN